MVALSRPGRGALAALRAGARAQDVPRKLRRAPARIGGNRAHARRGAFRVRHRQAGHRFDHLFPAPPPMFLNAIMLAGVGAAVMPIVLHLLARARYRTVDWGAML